MPRVEWTLVLRERDRRNNRGRSRNRGEDVVSPTAQEWVVGSTTYIPSVTMDTVSPKYGPLVS